MAEIMTDEELQLALESAEEIDFGGYENPLDEDDYIRALLYRMPNGCHFRLNESSGMNSIHNGAGNVAERLSAEEVSTWTTFS